MTIFDSRKVLRKENNFLIYNFTIKKYERNSNIIKIGKKLLYF